MATSNRQDTGGLEQRTVLVRLRLSLCSCRMESRRSHTQQIPCITSGQFNRTRQCIKRYSQRQLQALSCSVAVQMAGKN